MKHTILLCMILAGLAWAQDLNPQVIQNTRTMMQTVERNATNASNQALEGVTPPSQPTSSSPNKVQPSPFRRGPAPAPTTAPAKTNAPSAKTATVQPKAHSAAAKHAPATKAAKAAAPPAKPAEKPAEAAPASGEAQASTGEATTTDTSAAENKFVKEGKRDPFISPVVSHAGGSGCSTGKKCLDIGDINLRGVVHAETGFIAVVTNNLNKAYFLRENDPVFNGYVIKITEDSITFKEMLQDRLGKPFTREVVKRILTPAV